MSFQQDLGFTLATALLITVTFVLLFVLGRRISQMAERRAKSESRYKDEIEGLKNNLTHIEQEIITKNQELEKCKCELDSKDKIILELQERLKTTEHTKEESSVIKTKIDTIDSSLKEFKEALEQLEKLQKIRKTREVSTNKKEAKEH